LKALAIKIADDYLNAQNA